MSIPFIDLQAQRAVIADKIDAAIASVLEDGRFINGPALFAFEKALGDFGAATHALGCANGSDALLLSMLALGVGEGDAVFCPAFTFAATAEMIPWTGGTPVLVDILPGSYNIDPAHLRASIEMIEQQGKLKPKAIIAVDLFGRAADYPALKSIADDYGMRLIADSAQGFGCSLDGKQPLHWADMVTTSFFPAKPLGCYGDGGAILTNNDDWAAQVHALRNHGMGENRYEHVRLGWNSRLDSIQAAILLEKLKIFPGEIIARNAVAKRYGEGLKKSLRAVPAVPDDGTCVWAQYTIEHDNRDALAAHLMQHDVPSAVHYPKPLDQQPAYCHYPVGPGGLPVSAAASRHVISLPMHPYLDEKTQNKIINAVNGFNR